MQDSEDEDEKAEQEGEGESNRLLKRRRSGGTGAFLCGFRLLLGNEFSVGHNSVFRLGLQHLVPIRILGLIMCGCRVAPGGVDGGMMPNPSVRARWSVPYMQSQCPLCLRSAKFQLRGRDQGSSYP